MAAVTRATRFFVLPLPAGTTRVLAVWAKALPPRRASHSVGMAAVVGMHAARRLSTSVATPQDAEDDALDSALRSRLAPVRDEAIDDLSDLWDELSPAESQAIREVMQRTPAGRTVLQAAIEGKISLVFTYGDPPPGAHGMAGVAAGTRARIFLHEAMQDDAQASGIEHTAAIAVHEGMHALGVAGSRRAEALCRIEQLRVLGVEISASALRRVMKGIRHNSEHYDMPWRIDRCTPHFPDLQF